MPSTFTANLAIEKVANGEESGEWGNSLNLNFDTIDRALDGSVNVAISSSDTTYTLTTTDATLSTGNFSVIKFNGSPSSGVTVTISPNTVGKAYYIVNNIGQTLTFTQGTGGNATVPADKNGVIYADGAGSGAQCVNVSDSFALGSTVSITGGTITGITDLLVADGGTSSSTASDARTALGTVIGTDILAYDANLQSFVTAFTLPTSDGTANQIVITNGSGTLSFATQTVQEYTASGAISAGDVVALNSNGTVSTVTTVAANADDWLGIAAKAISDTADGFIQTRGYVDTNQTGLTTNSVYYLADDGSLTTSSASGRKVGRALSATRFLVTEGNV